MWAAPGRPFRAMNAVTPSPKPGKTFDLLPIQPTAEMLAASGLDEAAALEAWARMLAAAPGRQAYACNRLTERKTAEIIAERGFQIVGHVLVNAEGRFCISSQAAVRWLSAAHYSKVMHASNRELFGQD